MAHARVRVTKLERAMEAVGESDPTYPALVNALKRARAQAQVRPIAHRITATESFIERAKKRVEKERKEVDKAKAESAKAEAQLALEEQSLRAGESRLHVLRQEADGAGQSPPPSPLSTPPTVPVDFAQKVAQLRTVVQDLLREREQLKSQLAGQASIPHEEGPPRKARSLASPSPTLMSISNEPALGSREPSRLMETLIDRADSALRSSWAPEQMVARCGWRDARCGVRGVRVGEADNPGPTEDYSVLAVGDFHPLTQWDSGASFSLASSPEFMSSAPASVGASSPVAVVHGVEPVATTQLSSTVAASSCAVAVVHGAQQQVTSLRATRRLVLVGGGGPVAAGTSDNHSHANVEAEVAVGPEVFAMSDSDVDEVPLAEAERRPVDDEDAESTESVQFGEEVLSDVEAFREEFDSEDGSQDEVEEPEVVERVEPLQLAPVGRRIPEGFASLDSVDLANVLRRRGHVMRSVPVVIKGAYTATMRICMEEVLKSKRVHDVDSDQRAWKLFLLLPRMLLFRPTTGGNVSKGHLMERLDLFTNGQWNQLIARSNQISQAVASINARRRRHEAGSDLEHRAARAEKLVALGEFVSWQAGVGWSRNGTGEHENVGSAYGPQEETKRTTKPSR